MNECTTPDCPNTAGQLYLCDGCTRDLAGRLEQGKALIPELGVTIAGLDNLRVGNAEGCNGDRVAGSQAPLDLKALDVQMTLQEDTRYPASAYAADPWSAGEMGRVVENVRQSELLVSGPEEEHVDHEGNRARVKEIAPPMPTRELLPWLRENAKISLSSQIIRHYAQRGFLIPVHTGPCPTYWPHEVIDAYHHHSRGGRNSL